MAASRSRATGWGVPRHRRHAIGTAAIAAVASFALAACGSSKPAYCTDRTNLQNSIKGITSLSLSSGVSGLQSQLGKIQSDATTLVKSAQGDFPTETSAIKSSVAGLSSAVKSVPPSPSAQQ